MISFSIIPEKQLRVFTKPIAPAAAHLSSFFPFLHETLMQADLDYKPHEYAALALGGALVNGIFFLALILIVGLLAKADLLLVATAAGLMVFLFSFVTIVSYPALTAAKRAREIDRYLIYAVRHMVIQLRSGVPLFNALASVSVDYGEASREFSKIVADISSGADEVDIISEAASRAPSLHFRRVLWQVANSLKVGADVSTGLVAQLDDLTRDRIEQIKRFGQELSSWSVFYMLGAIIFPSLGVTVLIVLTTFLGAKLPSFIFAIIVAGLILFQLFFMNLVSTRRPYA